VIAYIYYFYNLSYTISDKAMYISDGFLEVFNFTLVLTCLVFIVYRIYCFTSKKNKFKNKYKIFVSIFIFISIIPFFLQGKLFFYSNYRMIYLFDENIAIFEEIVDYTKNPSFRRPYEDIVNYMVIDANVYCDANDVKAYEELEDVHLENLILELNKKGYYQQVKLYKNGDISFWAKEGFTIEYTSYDDVKEILNQYGFYSKLKDGWYLKGKSKDPRICPYEIVDMMERR
ncbi:unnamed protein product, partial [marine sediment metagenome]